jgi:hypothetical protein
VPLGEKVGEYPGDAGDLNLPAAEVIIGSTEFTQAEKPDLSAAPTSQPTTETRGANYQIADR